ncbi:unnamed protein product, partial [Prunus brigantina]
FALCSLFSLFEQAWPLVFITLSLSLSLSKPSKTHQSPCLLFFVSFFFSLTHTDTVMREQKQSKARVFVFKMSFP